MTHDPLVDCRVVVRCFNEATVVGDVIAGLRARFPHVIAVDDGSSDGSAAVMRAAGATVVRHRVNLGAGAALQTGLDLAARDGSARYVACFDADGQHRVDDLVSMVRRIDAEGMDVLLGSRFLDEGVAQATIPAGRRRLLAAARTFERLTSSVRLSDAHNGLRVFTTSFAATISLKAADMSYASELVAHIGRSGARIAEHPVTIDYTDYSRSKGQRSINAINIGIDTLLGRLLERRAT